MFRTALGLIVCAVTLPATFYLYGDSEMAPLVAAFSFGAVFIVALPSIIWLRLMHFVNFGSVILTGLFGGLGAASPMIFSPAGPWAFYWFGIVFAILGLVHALAFWVIAVVGNPWLQTGHR